MCLSEIAARWWMLSERGIFSSKLHPDVEDWFQDTITDTLMLDSLKLNTATDSAATDLIDEVFEGSKFRI